MAVAYPDVVGDGAERRYSNGLESTVSTMTCSASCRPRKSADWYALCVRPRYEKLTAMMLTNKGYETLLPLYKCKRRRPDRYKEIQLPLFPGYLFCQFDPSTRLPILTTPGVLHVVGSGRVPIPIDELEMQAVRHLAASALAAEPWQYLELGQRVYIDDGPLAGTVGLLIAVKNSHRLILSITLLRRAVAVEIDRSWIKKQ